MTEQEQEVLLKELEAFSKEKDRIKKIVGKIGGSNNIQNKRVNTLLVFMVFTLLFTGGVLEKISIELAMYCSILIVLSKLIWILYEMKKANHFQYWILNSLEVKLNKISIKVRKIEKLLEEEKEKKEDKVVDEYLK